MRQLLNTLFVTSEDVYLSLDGENVVANRGGEAVARYPLHTLQSIVTFSYSGASPALMGACAKREIGLAFCTRRGHFLARVSGQMQGNVLLRRTQYRVADDPSESCRVARMMILGKVYNARWSVDRTRRDHAMRIDSGRFTAVSQQLQGLLPQITAETSLDSLRGLEGAGATAYFRVLDDMILQGRIPSFSVSAAADRRWTLSMPCCPLRTAFWPTTVLPPWNVSAWMPMWVFCTVTVRDVNPLRWI